MTSLSKRTTNSQAITSIVEAADPLKLKKSGLPPFTPTKADVLQFLEIWKAVKAQG